MHVGMAPDQPCIKQSSPKYIYIYIYILYIIAAISIPRNLPGVAACPTNIVYGTDAGMCGANISIPVPAQADICGIASLQQNVSSGSFFPIGASSVMFKATNLGGLSSSCYATVTVVDSEAPTIGKILKL